MIDHDRLLNFDIPEVVQAYGPREVANYALSVGMGRDPMDMNALPFLAALKDDLRVMPGIVNVLGHPGFWLANPATGVDAGRLVHGEQGFTIHNDLPPEGVVRAKTRVTGLVDKGERRGALLYYEKVIVNDADGTPLATCRGTTVLRANGGFGGPDGPIKTPHAMPDGAPMHVFETEIRPEQALLYRWNGDPNPLHLDPRAAREAGFERPILHGLCTFGCAAHALLVVLCNHDASRFGSMEGRFTAPVYPGETLACEIWEDGSFRAIVRERDKTVLNNGIFHFRKGAV